MRDARRRRRRSFARPSPPGRSRRTVRPRAGVRRRSPLRGEQRVDRVAARVERVDDRGPRAAAASSADDRAAPLGGRPRARRSRRRGPLRRGRSKRSTSIRMPSRPRRREQLARRGTRPARTAALPPRMRRVRRNSRANGRHEDARAARRRRRAEDHHRLREPARRRRRPSRAACSVADATTSAASDAPSANARHGSSG